MTETAVFPTGAVIACSAAALLAACAGPLGDEKIIGRATAAPSPAASAAVAAAPTAASTIGPTPNLPPPVATFTRQPTASPTLGPLVTATPAPPELCPVAGGRGTTIDLGPDPKSLVDPLELQIRAYLNARGSAVGLQTELERLKVFDSGYELKKEAQVLVTDVTGDTTPDVLVELVVDYSEVGGALFVFGCREESFETLYRRGIGGAQHRPLGPEDGIVTVRDMNADGVPEVVMAEVTNVSARGYVTREFQIMEWDGSHFAYLIPPPADLDYPASAASSFDRAGTIQDVEGDGLLELLLPQAIVPEYPDSGPQRMRTDIWGWNGDSFGLTRWEYEEPTHRFQAVQDGDQAAVFGEFDRALSLYRHAIYDPELLSWSQGRWWPDNWYRLSQGGATPTPDPNEPPRLRAYARYRILLLHAARGYLPEARIVYDTLEQMFPAGSPGHPYAQLAAAFWNSFQAGQRMDEGCHGAIEYAEAHPEEILEPLGSGFYGWFNRDYVPEDICPFR